MLGLLGNVAEVKALRPQLLTKQFITVFRCDGVFLRVIVSVFAV